MRGDEGSGWWDERVGQGTGEVTGIGDMGFGGK